MRSDGFKQFYDEIASIFREYSALKSDHDSFIKRIYNIEAVHPFARFYQLFVVNSIYLDQDDYVSAMTNFSECLKLYDHFTEDEKLNCVNEYLIAKYHDIILNEYYHPDGGFRVKLEKLKQEISNFSSNKVLSDLQDKINIYFNVVSREPLINIGTEDITEMDYNVFKLWYENLASKIFSREDNCKTVSHYTRLESSFNILKNNEIWVSRQDFLNDKSELTYFINAYPKLIDDIKDNINNDCEFTDEDKSFLGSQIQIADRIVQSLFGIIKPEALNAKERNIVQDFRKEYFVLSFSKNQDSLALWGNYTEFTGVNLQFDRNELISILDNKSFNPLYLINPKNNVYKIFSNYYFGEVLYDLEDVKKSLLKDFKAVLHLHKTYFHAIREFVVTRMLIELIRIRMLFTKINAFSCEEEYRFVFTLDETLYQTKIDFRTTKDYFIPFIKIPFNLDVIKEITVGPRNNSDLVIQGYQEYFNFRNTAVKINKSAIPYR